MKSLLHENRNGMEMRPSTKELLIFLFKWFDEVHDGIYQKTNIYEYQPLYKKKYDLSNS